MDKLKILTIESNESSTDFIAYNDGKITPLKVKSSSDQFIQTIIRGIQHFKSKNFIPDLIIFATIVGNKTIIDRKGAKTALITTSGFKDLIKVGKRVRESVYNLFPKRSDHVIDSKDIFEVDERVLYNGKVETELNRKSIRNTVKNILSNGYETVAVSLINSPKNSKHENDIASVLKKIDIPYTLSSRISGEYREYERTSSAILNSYLIPTIRQFLEAIHSLLEPHTELQIMQVNGGVTNYENIAQNYALQTLFSNQVGAVLGARKIAKKLDISKLITLGIRNDSTDISILDDHITITNRMEIGNLPVQLPSVMIRTLGKGGSEKFEICDDNFLKISTDRGEEPTLIDALKYLKYINPSENLERERFIKKYFTQKGIKNIDSYIEGIYKISNVSIAREIKNIAYKSGHEAKEFSLFVFGEIGGILAAKIAKELDIDEVIIPPYSTMFSSYGMLFANSIKDQAQTILKIIRPSKNHDYEDLKKRYRVMVSNVRKQLISETRGAKKIKIFQLADMRYEGESQEITIPFSENLVENFHFEHKKLYGYFSKNSLIELVTIRVRGIVYIDEPEVEIFSNSVIHFKPYKKEDLLYDGEIKTFEFYNRANLPQGATLSGPAIVTEYAGSTLVPENFDLSIDQFENIILTKKG